MKLREMQSCCGPSVACSVGILVLTDGATALPILGALANPHACRLNPGNERLDLAASELVVVIQRLDPVIQREEEEVQEERRFIGETHRPSGAY